MNAKAFLLEELKTIFRHPATGLRLEHPDWNGTRIARELGITRQAVHQALKQTMLNIPRRDPHVCLDCDARLWPGSVRCRTCYLKLHTVTLTCETCGKKFPRRLSYLVRANKDKAKHTWCGRNCQGKWLSEQNKLGKE